MYVNLENSCQKVDEYFLLNAGIFTHKIDDNTDKSVSAIYTKLKSEITIFASVKFKNNLLIKDQPVKDSPVKDSPVKDPPVKDPLVNC